MTRETGISFSQMFLCYLNVPCEQRLLSFMNDSVNAKSHGKENSTCATYWCLAITTRQTISCLSVVLSNLAFV